MDAKQLRERVDLLLHDRFEGAQVYVSLNDQTDKVEGYIVWPGFEGVEPIDRHKRVTDVLESALGRDALRIYPISTYAPREFQVMKAVG